MAKVAVVIGGPMELEAPLSKDFWLPNILWSSVILTNESATNSGEVWAIDFIFTVRCNALSTVANITSYYAP